MPVPKATVYEDSLATARKNQIRTSRKVSPMQPVAIAKSMNKSTDGPFWAGVAAFNARHSLAALRPRERVCHSAMFTRNSSRSHLFISLLTNWIRSNDRRGAAPRLPQRLRSAGWRQRRLAPHVWLPLRPRTLCRTEPRAHRAERRLDRERHPEADLGRANLPVWPCAAEHAEGEVTRLATAFFCITRAHEDISVRMPISVEMDALRKTEDDRGTT